MPVSFDAEFAVTIAAVTAAAMFVAMKIRDTVARALGKPSRKNSGCSGCAISGCGVRKNAPR